MRFAAITDLHFGRAAPYRGVDRKLTGHAPALTAAFVDDMNRRVRPDFVVVLGDVIEDESPSADLDNFTTAADILSGLDMPVRYVFGNHDLVHLTHEQLLAVSGEIALNSSFDVDGWHLVRLHSTASFTPPSGPEAERVGEPSRPIRARPWPERPVSAANKSGNDTATTRQALTCSRSLPDTGYRLRGEIAPEDLEWLDRDLAAASGPTLVFTHFAPADLNLAGQFWFDRSPDMAMLANRAEVRDVLECHDVAMAMNGHVHWNNHTVHNGISYITIQSLVENTANDGEPAGAWALVEAGATHLDITVSGRDPASYRVPRPLL